MIKGPRRKSGHATVRRDISNRFAWIKFKSNKGGHIKFKVTIYRDPSAQIYRSPPAPVVVIRQAVPMYPPQPYPQPQPAGWRYPQGG